MNYKKLFYSIILVYIYTHLFYTNEIDQKVNKYFRHEINIHGKPFLQNYEQTYLYIVIKIVSAIRIVH